MTLGVYSLRNLAGLGCDLSNPDPTDPSCVIAVNPTPTYPSSLDLPTPSGVNATLPTVTAGGAACVPNNVYGPLAPGQNYCSAPSPSVPASCPTGSTCSIIAGVPNTAVYVLGAIFGVFLVMGMKK